MAGLNAYSKGKSLGLFEPTPAKVRAKRAEKAAKAAVFQVKLLNRAVPVLQTEDGLRAVAKAMTIEPEGVEKYLASKFKDQLESVRDAMAILAASPDAETLAAEAYALYEKFRPEIPAGEAGRGLRGP